MNVLDIIYIAAVLCAAFGGFRAGFLQKISFPMGALFGLFNATVLMSSTSEQLKRYLDWDETAISVTAFIVIMVLSIIAISLAVYVVSWILKLLGLNIFNRIAGALLSAFVTLLIVTAIIDLTSLVAPNNSITGKTTQDQSVLYNKVVTDIYKKTITRLF